MEQIKLYDCLPTRNIEYCNLYLGWRAFTKVYVKKGTVLYNIKYRGYKPFSIDYVAHRDGFYVHNGLVIEHAKWYDWGYTDKEPILFEMWDSKEEFESGSQVILNPPKYGTGYEDYFARRQEEIIAPNDSESCYTYLMRDESTGYYKIGMSKEPTYRERTLQCEKPTISLLWSKKFATRSEAREQEKSLHQRYAHKNKRGEWFRLSEQDVIDIKNSNLK